MISGFFIKNSYCMMIPFEYKNFEYKNTASGKEAQSSSASLPEFYAKSTQIYSELPAEIWEIIIALIDINDDKTISGLMRTSVTHRNLTKDMIKKETKKFLHEKKVTNLPGDFYNKLLGDHSLKIIPIHILAHLLNEYPSIFKLMYRFENILYTATDCLDYVKFNANPDKAEIDIYDYEYDKESTNYLKMIINIARQKMIPEDFNKFINYKKKTNDDYIKYRGVMMLIDHTQDNPLLKSLETKHTVLFNALGTNSHHINLKILLETGCFDDKEKSIALAYAIQQEKKSMVIRVNLPSHTKNILQQ